ncbi:hypothetical protein [Paenarthrobacter aurescens]|uniref:Uncharacterized protein n=1 Tax=Paenarthrobacter aurescens TaxID=43663 RepID=A0A4Y3NF52_PAEAU|nr:hypothetical protein [Paenarthrobacter aurescens]MDO6144999.1 hypothetical protein [Paenarthrobacter aurescens]MDO6148844.1 hypothetical protein [Paenarthrobacter aurescens]MDO6160090.1 hypothetical protein [Paenarthrobacter aurescens]MDO6163949.1 hypothetical protein [Paenarthrobacter aurescens]GEB17339.1 hypothetical protein AAU01_00940 [Paenarthrobacter aurescens]
MSDSKLTPPPGKAAMSVRECRLILERLLVASGALPGEVPAARDALLAAEVHGLGLLQLIHAQPLTLPSKPVRYDEAGPIVVVDGSGRLSALLIPALRDIILERGTVEISVSNVTAPELLQALDTVPELDSRRISVSVQDSNTVVVSAEPANDTEAAKRRAARTRRITDAHLNGLPVPGVVWLELYQRSNAALLSESAETRSHAGYKDVDETGRIVKQMDDDVDVEFALQQLAG